MHKDNKGEYYIETKTAIKTKQSTTQNTPPTTLYYQEDLESPPQKIMGYKTRLLRVPNIALEIPASLNIRATFFLPANFKCSY